MIRIVLVDDQELVRAGLRALVEHDGDITVVAEAGDGRAGVGQVRRTVPDVVLMDIRMPVLDGVGATRAIVADPALDAVRVAVLSTFDEDDHVLDAIDAGAAGYLLKDIAPVELRAAVRRIAAGDALLSPAVTRRVMASLAAGRARVRPELVAHLTDREREVLTRIGHGETNAEVGAGLHLSPATARTYTSRLLAKLGARDRARLVVVAYESGLVAPGRALPPS